MPPQFQFQPIRDENDDPTRDVAAAPAMLARIERVDCTTPTPDEDLRGCPPLDKRQRRTSAVSPRSPERPATSSMPPMPRNPFWNGQDEAEELLLLRARWLRSS